jgi:hypothetical protein
MATNIRSWGILGNPSKEKIEQYKNMPVGSFKNMVKNLNRGKKGKVLKEFEVFVTQRNVDLKRGVIKVSAFDWNEAAGLVRLRHDEIVWDETNYKTDVKEYVYHSMDPLKY